MREKLVQRWKHLNPITINGTGPEWSFDLVYPPPYTFVKCLTFYDVYNSNKLSNRKE